MTRYTNVKVNISEGQKEKLQHAIKAGCLTVSIRLGHESYSEGDIDCIPNTDERYISFAKKKKKKGWELYKETKNEEEETEYETRPLHHQIRFIDSLSSLLQVWTS